MKQLLLASALLIGLWPDSASADCPATVPVPANQTDIACYTVNKPINQRCATAIEPAVCTFLNNTAKSQNLVTQGGFDFLQSIGFCAIVMDPGTGYRIVDFCPVGCFAATTQMLSSFSPDGTTNYVAAQSVRPNIPLLSLADESLSDVSLAPHSVKRVVYGPESTHLFVFRLSNGQTLKVTQHHPMVLDNGKIIEAAQVDMTMAFAGIDGNPVAIKAITREKPTADVFNFETRSDKQLGHIIVAEGVLVGDWKIQSELADEEGSIALRR
jgi:hypothetical protein